MPSHLTGALPGEDAYSYDNIHQSNIYMWDYRERNEIDELGSSDSPASP